jgi:anti-sigma-K factor RskA
MEHDAYNELTAAYALDALDEVDVRAYEDHLAGCDDCQNDLASLSATAVALAYAAPPVDPPAALRGRILEAARAERQNVVPLRPRRSRPSRTVTAIAAVAGIAACLAIALGVWNVSLSNQLDEARQALQTVPLTGANGSVVVGGEDKGVLVISSLDAAPAGKTYEAWVIQDGAAAPAGVFAGGGTVAVSLEHPVPSGSIVAVTVEDEGGAEQPTSKPIITSAPV